MRILVLNGSPRPKGNTKQMIEAFRMDAVSSGHRVDVVFGASLPSEGR